MHVFEDRGENRKTMIVVLKELGIRGDLRTTAEYLDACKGEHRNGMAGFIYQQPVHWGAARSNLSSDLRSS
jgi:hypothetical protein